MAGLFGFFDYSKPGPGVPKDGPPKARIVVFFEIIQRKFWNLIKMNFMFNLFNLPAMILGMLASIVIFPQFMPGLDMTDANNVLGDLVSRFIILTIFMCIPVVTVGPAQAGFTYILRNYSREEHAFIWSDFAEHAKNNFKQSLIVSGIDFIVTFVMLYALRIYFAINNGSLLFTFATTMMILLLCIYLSMHLYIYPMMVTFKLTTKQLYKNSLYFGLGKLLPNLGIVLLCALILLASFIIIPEIGLILYVIFTVSFIGMITNFYAYGKIKKYMMNDEDEEDEDEEDEIAGESSGEEDFDELSDSDGSDDRKSDTDDEAKKSDGDVKRYY